MIENALKNDNTFLVETIVNSALLQINTMALGIVVNVNEDKSVDIQIANKVIAPQGSVSNPLIKKVPTLSIQGGVAGVIIDYQIGDVVFVGFNQRDMSNYDYKGEYEPRSFRKFSYSDAMVISKVSYQEPKTYIHIKQEDIQIVADNINISTTGKTSITGDTPVALKGGKVKVTGVKAGEDTIIGEIIDGSNKLFSS